MKRRYNPTRVATETEVPSTAGTAYAISRVTGDGGLDEEGWAVGNSCCVVFAVVSM